MCIAICHLPGSEPLTVKQFNMCWENNPHGGGLMYAADDAITIRKSLDKETFRQKYRLAFKRCADTKTALIAHFRYSTHGKKNITNCQPIRVSKEVALVHNGVIYKCGKHGSNKSDTYYFAKNICAHLPRGWVLNKTSLMLLEAYIGYGSKVIFLTSKGKVRFLRQSKGEWDNLTWYSNDTYKTKKYRGSAYTPYGYQQQQTLALGDHSRKRTTYQRPTVTESHNVIDISPYDNQPLAYCSCGIELTPAERSRGMCNDCFDRYCRADFARRYWTEGIETEVV